MPSQEAFAKIEIVLGDITQESMDAVVNAANPQLLGGSGVNGAIHRAGGPAILEECKKLGGCDTGDAKITGGGDLPAKHVIHAVGPVYRDGKSGEPEKLAGCYRRSLEIAHEKGLKSVAFPAISCGVYGYPIPEGARVAVEAVADALDTYPDIERVRFVLFTGDIRDAFRAAYDDLKQQAS